MDIISLVIILITIAGLFIWNRTEGRSDIRHMDAKLESMRNLNLAIHDEIKDFHNRLVEVEKNRK